jgi:peroxiredoxin
MAHPMVRLRGGSAVLVAAVLLGGWILPARALEDTPAPKEKEPSPEQEKREKEAEARLLEIGKVAPDFTLPLLGGGEVALANLQKFGKAVLVVFWSAKPERGGSTMPKLQKLHEQFEAKGLSTVAINPAEDAGDVTKFVEAGKLTVPVALDGKETNRAVTGVYRARNLPTLYLLDPDGKVLWRAVRLKEEPLREALAKAGVK